MLNKASFTSRDACITCGNTRLKTLSSGSFKEGPVHEYLSSDPWGVSPLPYIEHETWRFVQCEACGQKYHQRILDDTWLATYYSEWISAESIEEYFEICTNGRVHENKYGKGVHDVERVLLLERATRRLRGDGPVSILDFGCGDGDFLFACELFGFQGVGVEFAASRSQRRKVDFFPSLAAMEEEIGDRQFHAVTLFEVLEHLPDPLGTLHELAKFLPPGGVLVLETPDCSDVTDIVTRQDYARIHPLGHINGFTPKTLELIAAKAGFERIHAGTPQLTADPLRAYKREIRRVVDYFVTSKTQLFFQKRS